jgi:hypothetical protein
VDVLKTMLFIILLKLENGENPISRIEPCEITNDEFTIKEILE